LARIEQPARDDTDWRLLASSGAGDGDAFAALVERHQARLLALCERVLGDPAEARDAAQEVFLKAWRHAAGAEPRGELYTWLYRIALNHCFNRMRRRKLARFFSLDRPAITSEGEPRSIEPVEPGAGAEVELLTRERWRRTRAAIDRLPENQRAVLLLARFEGLSQREIAATLGVSEGAVESRLVRAMRRLRELEASGEDRAQEPGTRRVSERKPDRL